MNRYFRTTVIIVAVTIAMLTGAAYPIDSESQKYPDVTGVKVQARGRNIFDFDITISSPYDNPRRYADAFRVTGTDGVPYGERQLLHDHADEQPFTRDLYGVYIPPGVSTVVVQARDKKHGYGGKSVQIVMPKQ